MSEEKTAKENSYYMERKMEELSRTFGAELYRDMRKYFLKASQILVPSSALGYESVRFGGEFFEYCLEFFKEHIQEVVTNPNDVFFTETIEELVESWGYIVKNNAVAYVKENYTPEEVFDTAKLEIWAEASGYEYPKTWQEEEEDAVAQEYLEARERSFQASQEKIDRDCPNAQKGERTYKRDPYAKQAGHEE